MGVAGPAYRLTPEQLPRLVARLLEAAGQIPIWLGYRQPPVKANTQEEKIP